VTASTRPIPPMRGSDGWRSVPIDPIDEPLVAVSTIGGRVDEDPQYFAWGLPGAEPGCRVRAGVAESLDAAARSLPDGYGLLVWDGYRRFETQRSLFETYRAQLVAANPEWPPAVVDREAARYVTPPSRSPVAPPPHLTGGAVDLTLVDADGGPLDLGTAFDAFVPEAGALALESDPGAARAHRRILYWAMAGAGFTAYVEEWWHFDLGNQFWGLATGKVARYGPAVSI
jgi:zinc D-Ala-D-Ala dipeptidase